MVAVEIMNTEGEHQQRILTLSVFMSVPVGALLSRMCSPCALTLNSMFAEYALAFPRSRKRCLVKTSKHRTA